MALIHEKHARNGQRRRRETGAMRYAYAMAHYSRMVRMRIGAIKRAVDIKQ